jgi:type IV pilus assembly protein PilB
MSQDFLHALKDELANIAVESNFIEKEEIDKLKKHAKNTDTNLYDLLKKDGHISEEKLLSHLEKKYGISSELNPAIIVPDIKNFPFQYCYKNGIVPLEFKNNLLTVGVCAPSSLNSLKNLNLLIGKKTSAKFIPTHIVFEFLGQKHVYTEIKESIALEQVKPSKGTKSPAGIRSSEINNEVPLDLGTIGQKKDDGIPDYVFVKSKTERKSINLSGDVISSVDDILSTAINTSASDIHIEIFKDKSQIRFRKNGSLLEINDYEKFITNNYNAVIARIKILANLDIAERRLPQDGKISYKAKNGPEVDFRISILPTNLGERVVIRILNSSSLAISIQALGFNKLQEEAFIKAIDAPQGMVLVTGPTGSGKSTTLYGAMNYLNKPGINILTAEDPVEYTMTGISQVQVREDIGLTFASALRSFLRQDPEIILVGEIRDGETADIATKAALTGHLVLSTLHTNSAIGSISRLINMGLPPYLVSSALTLVVAQRLLRKNCKECLIDIDMGRKEVEGLVREYKVPHETIFKKGSGCSHCSNTGYSGRIAVHEVLTISKNLQKGITNNASEGELLEIAEKDGYQTMEKNAILHIINGTVSIEEYSRVVPIAETKES